jgi:hypothetical protein
MKKLLVERAIAVHASGSALCESTGRAGYVVEAGAPKRPGVLMTVKLPATTLDKMNENRRTYRRTIMDSAMQRAKPEFEARSMLSSVNEHPEDPYVTPGQASHIVTEAWCENDGYLWNRWDVLNTGTGRDLAALIEAGASFGVSIRGLGSQDNLGNIQDDYEYLGTDCVGQPSAKIRTAPELVNQEGTADRRAPNLHETALITGNAKMKNKQEASTYVREQLTLAKTEGRMDALRRLIKVEGELAVCSLPAPELMEAFNLLESGKTELDGRPASAPASLNESRGAAPATVEALQATIAAERKAHREALDKLVKTFRTKRETLEQSVAERDAKIEALKTARKALSTRLEAVSGRLLQNHRALRAERRVGRMAQGSRLRLHTVNERLRVELSAAEDLAVQGVLSTNAAIAEAARLTKATKAPKAPAPKAPVRESSGGRVVRTEVGGRKATAPVRGERPQTNANRNGTTRVPGFI